VVPDEIAHRRILFIQKMGLGFGAFDFVEQHDGKIVFLECNPNGQYGWLEEDLGFPISASIASALVRVAKDRQ